MINIKAEVVGETVVRSIISVFALFVDGTRPFSARDWKDALKYVGFPMAQLGELALVLRQLDGEVGSSVALAAMTKENL